MTLINFQSRHADINYHRLPSETATAHRLRNSIELDQLDNIATFDSRTSSCASLGRKVSMPPGLDGLRYAVERIETTLWRKPTDAEILAAQRDPVDVSKNSVDICTLGAAAAHRRYQRHQEAGNTIRSKPYLCMSALGHGVFVLAYVGTLPLACLYHACIRASGRSYVRKRTAAGVQLDMAARDLLQLRNELRSFCEHAPNWVTRKSVNQEAARLALNEARSAINNLCQAVIEHPNVKVRTSDLMKMHLVQTREMLPIAEAYVFHWHDPSVFKTLGKFHDESICKRLVSPRFRENVVREWP